MKLKTVKHRMPEYTNCRTLVDEYTFSRVNNVVWFEVFLPVDILLWMFISNEIKQYQI